MPIFYIRDALFVRVVAWSCILKSILLTSDLDIPGDIFWTCPWGARTIGKWSPPWDHLGRSGARSLRLREIFFFCSLLLFDSLSVCLFLLPLRLWCVRSELFCKGKNPSNDSGSGDFGTVNLRKSSGSVPSMGGFQLRKPALFPEALRLIGELGMGRFGSVFDKARESTISSLWRLRWLLRWWWWWDDLLWWWEDDLLWLWVFGVEVEFDL